MELDSGTDSVTSTPRKGIVNESHRVRLMCSFGGKILPRPHDNQLRYVGGDTRIVAISRSSSFSSLVSKLSKLTGAIPGEFTVKYQLPNEDLDALITVSSDEDVENMMDEWERFNSTQANKTARLRLFLFPNSDPDSDSRASSITSLLDGSTKRESWFLDALNGGRSVSGELERGRSEVSSIVSEVPDYLFGLDNSEDPGHKLKHAFRAVLNDGIPGSDPGSPIVTSSSPFCSSSSAPACVPTTPKNPEILSEPGSGGEHRPMLNPVQQQPRPVWGHHAPYPGHAPVQPVPVYYMAGPGPNPVQAVHQAPGQFVQQYQMQQGPVPVPIGYQPVSVSGQMYTGPVRPDQYHDMQGRVGSNPGMYYGVRGGPVYPGMMMGGAGPMGEEMGGLGSDGGRSGPV